MRVGCVRMCVLRVDVRMRVNCAFLDGPVCVRIGVAVGVHMGVRAPA